jgi:hypothetical protein
MGPRLVLGDRREDVDCEPVRLRKIDRVKIDAGFHKVGDEGHVARQAVELCDDQGRAVQAAQFQGLGQFGAIAALAAFDLGQLSDQAPIAAIQVIADGGLLGVEAEPAAALSLRAYAIVGHKPAGMRRWHDVTLPSSDVEGDVTHTRGALKLKLVAGIARLPSCCERRKTKARGEARALTGAGWGLGGWRDTARVCHKRTAFFVCVPVRMKPLRRYASQQATAKPKMRPTPGSQKAAH